jgi:hypothetical protein
MLDVDAGKLIDLIDEAEDKRSTFLEGYEERVTSYQGGAAGKYPARGIWGHANPINHGFEYLSMMLPRWVYTNPDVEVTSRLPVAGEAIAKAHEHAMRQWVEDVNLARFLRLIGVDFGIQWAVTFMTPKARPDVVGANSIGSFRPDVSRIDPRMFLLDPHASSVLDARFIGHQWVMDKTDLVKFAEQQNEESDGDGPWDLTAIRSLSIDQGLDDLPEDMTRSVSRGEVLGYDLWVPEIQPDPDLTPEMGYHGAIVTLIRGLAQGSTMVRRPTPFFGPSSGPYVLFGAYDRPGSAYPMSPLHVVQHQEWFLNEMATAANKAAADYKRLVLGPAQPRGDEGEDIPFDAMPDGTYVEVPGFPPDMAPVTIELGGLTDQMLRQIQWAQELLARTSGMDTPQRGEVTGRGTATEHAIADAATETRSSFVADRFAEGVQKLLTNAAWYHHNDGRISYTFAEGEASDVHGSPQPWATFTGGPDEDSDEPDIPFEALQLKIVPMSMQRTSEPLQQRNTLTAFQIMSQIAPMIRQLPEIPWSAWLEKIGDALNIPDMGSGINYDLAAQLMQMQPGSQASSPPQVEAEIVPESRGAQRPALPGMLTGAASAGNPGLPSSG